MDFPAVKTLFSCLNQSKERTICFINFKTLAFFKMILTGSICILAQTHIVLCTLKVFLTPKFEFYRLFLYVLYAQGFSGIFFSNLSFKTSEIQGRAYLEHPRVHPTWVNDFRLFYVYLMARYVSAFFPDLTLIWKLRPNTAVTVVKWQHSYWNDCWW